MHIGRYKVCGLLGRGGMGAVYKVRQPHTGRMAALKLLRPTEELAMLVAEDELRRRFVREAEVMAALDRVTLHAPVRTGQVVLADVCGTGVDVVATRNL